MKKINIYCMLRSFAISLNASAEKIQNGVFQRVTGWQKDTEGAGDISLGNDFEVDGIPTNCPTALNIDYFDQAGDPFATLISDAWFANTLHQDLDLREGTAN